MAYEISPEAVMAFAVLEAAKSQKPVGIEDVSRLFFEVRKKGLEEVERVALRRLPKDTFYSDDVEAFLGRLLTAGYATARSPVSANARGVDLCKSIIQEEMRCHPEAMRKVAGALGFDMSLAT